MFRLKQKHSQKEAEKRPAADGRRLLAEQSAARAFAAGIAVALLLCWLWAMFTVATGRVFPWFSVLIGVMIGIAVQRFGRGLDWRFPVLAAVVAAFAAYAGNLMIGIFETGRYIEAAPLRVVSGLSQDSIKYFFSNAISPIDHIYAICACAVAAFFANRRLKRHEVLGLRTITPVTGERFRDG
ncbi:MAG: hypothetical protein O3A13_01395 [Proteobacteria bacterium]|nr:hypothetical protein [Pseudomonadota bacterium]